MTIFVQVLPSLFNPIKPLAAYFFVCQRLKNQRMYFWIKNDILLKKFQELDLIKHFVLIFFSWFYALSAYTEYCTCIVHERFTFCIMG